MRVRACACVRYLRRAAAGVGVARGVVAQGRQAGQDEVDGADLQRHAAQQDAIVGGQRRAAEKRSQHVEGQRGQHVGRRRLQDVTCGDKARTQSALSGPIGTLGWRGRLAAASGRLDGGGNKFYGHSVYR